MSPSADDDTDDSGSLTDSSTSGHKDAESEGMTHVASGGQVNEKC